MPFNSQFKNCFYKVHLVVCLIAYREGLFLQLRCVNTAMHCKIPRTATHSATSTTMHTATHTQHTLQYTLLQTLFMLRIDRFCICWNPRCSPTQFIHEVPLPLRKNKQDVCTACQQLPGQIMNTPWGQSILALWHRSNVNEVLIPICMPLDSSAVATRCNTLQHTATHCNTLQHTSQRCNTLQFASTRIQWHGLSWVVGITSHCNTLHHTAAHYSTLQHTATHYNTLQHAATHWNTM